jgi:hypothetical protein
MSAIPLHGPEPVLGIPTCSTRDAIWTWIMNQHYCAWRDLSGHRHGKRFISGPCGKRASGLFKLSRHQLKMVVVIFTGHASVRMRLRTVGLFGGDPTCRFCRKEVETVRYITVHAAARC